jgi:hypothetical protein
MSSFSFDGIQEQQYPFKSAPADKTDQLPAGAGLFILASGTEERPKPEFLGHADNIRQSVIDLKTAGIWDTAWNEPIFAVTMIFTRLVPDAKMRETEFQDLFSAYKPSINMNLSEYKKQRDAGTKHRNAQGD